MWGCDQIADFSLNEEVWIYCLTESTQTYKVKHVKLRPGVSLAELILEVNWEGDMICQIATLNNYPPEGYSFDGVKLLRTVNVYRPNNEASFNQLLPIIIERHKGISEEKKAAVRDAFDKVLRSLP